ncbi:MAG: hypothetical protein PUD36_01550, partial [Bacteroidales bacterium]|nr:hypothetical protein [Bacteroidales bacterium]
MKHNVGFLCVAALLLFGSCNHDDIHVYDPNGANCYSDSTQCINLIDSIDTLSVQLSAKALFISELPTLDLSVSPSDSAFVT